MSGSAPGSAPPGGGQELLDPRVAGDPAAVPSPSTPTDGSALGLSATGDRFHGCKASDQAGGWRARPFF
jgi:hypothetical protein